MAATIQEREQKKPPETAGKKKETLIQLLLRKIKELEDKFKKTKEQPEKDKIKKELEKVREEQKKLLNDFFKTDFGKKTKGQVEKLKDEIGNAIKSLTAVPPSEKQTYLSNFFGVLKTLREKTAIKEPPDLAEKYKGIAQAERDRVLEQAEKFVRKSSEKATPVASHSNQLDRVRAQLLEMAQSLLKEDPENTSAKDLIGKIARGEISDFELSRIGKILTTKIEAAKLLGKNKKSAEYRETKFEELISKFGINPDRHFREVDIYTVAEWMQFQTILKIEPDILHHYQLLFGFAEKTHNLNLWLSGQASIGDANRVMAQIKSAEYDEANRVPWVEDVAHIYEQYFSQLALLDGELTPTKIGWDPDEKTVWIHKKAREQLKASIIHHLLKTNEQITTIAAAEKLYKEQFLPREGLIMRLGYDVFIFGLRGDEIQAELDKARKFPEVGSPWHEDLHRVLDALSLPLRYWGGKIGINEILDRGKKNDLTGLYYFYTGSVKKDFETLADYQKAIKQAKKEGKLHFNILDIAGVLSVSDWRAEKAMEHIPRILTAFLGIEMSRKKWAGDEKVFQTEGYSNVNFAAKRTAFAWALKRNPFRVFQLADKQAQEQILRACGINSGKEFFEETDNNGFTNYDYLSQALRNLVNYQEARIKAILDPRKTKALQEAEARDFFANQKDKGLDFSFIGDSNKSQQLERFITAIQSHFGTIEMNGPYVKVGARGNKEFEKLIRKKFAFSLGTDDAMLGIMRFSELGEEALQRRFRDLAAAAEAAIAFWNFINNAGVILQNKEESIKAIKAIADALDKYQAEGADKFILTIIDRTIAMVQEDRLQKILPYPACKFRDSSGGRMGLTSEAEKIYGQNHLSKTKLELTQFIEDVVGSGVFRGMDILAVRKELYKKYHLGFLPVIVERVWRYGPAIVLGILAAGVLAIAKAVLEEMKKDVESV